MRPPSRRGEGRQPRRRRDRRPRLHAKRVAPGRYRITVADRGPGVDRQTGRAFVGTATWAVTLARGAYRFGSDPSRAGRLVVE